MATETFEINGRAYPIIDHTFDVVVVGAGGSGLFCQPFFSVLWGR